MYVIRSQEVHASEIAQLLNAPLRGSDFLVCGPATVDSLSDRAVVHVRELTTELLNRLGVFTHGVLVLAKDAAVPTPPGVAVVLVEDPEFAFVQVVREFFAEQNLPSVHASALIQPGAVLGSNVSVGPHCVIGGEVMIGNNTEILSGVVITGRATIGRNCLIKDRAVVGSEGYGFVTSPEGHPVHFPQCGRVIIGDHVWVGSNSTIERGAFKDTVVGDHVKIDDLVHVGNGCRIGRDSMLTAGVVLSEDVVVGERCWLMPNACVRSKVRIGDAVTVGLGSVVIRDVPPSSTCVGNPAQALRKQ